jgi:uncharacterized protein (DUF433 family)
MTTPTYDCIVWRPGRMSGQATIGESRLTASTLAGFVWAGDSVEETAEAYEVPPFAVELSCWWLTLHEPHIETWMFAPRRAWLKWALQWGDHAWCTRPNANHTHPGPPPVGKDEK